MIKSPYIPQTSLALKFMREKKKLTLHFVGKEVGIKPKDIDHIENGRRTVIEAEINNFLGCYGYSRDVFNQMLEIKPLTKQAANHYFLRHT